MTKEEYYQMQIDSLNKKVEELYAIIDGLASELMLVKSHFTEVTRC